MADPSPSSGSGGFRAAGRVRRALGDAVVLLTAPVLFAGYHLAVAVLKVARRRPAPVPVTVDPPQSGS